MATRNFSLALHRNDDGLTIHLLKLSLVLSELKKKKVIKRLMIYRRTEEISPSSQM